MKKITGIKLIGLVAVGTLLFYATNPIFAFATVMALLVVEGNLNNAKEKKEIFEELNNLPNVYTDEEKNKFFVLTKDVEFDEITPERAQEIKNKKEQCEMELAKLG